jgi:hypothetical protein
MAKKKKVEVETIDLPEFGYVAKDEHGVMLVLESNAGQDKHKHLEHAKKLKRPILIQIQSELFDTYRFRNMALTIDEAKSYVKELTRMIDYLEEA